MTVDHTMVAIRLIHTCYLGIFDVVCITSRAAMDAVALYLRDKEAQKERSILVSTGTILLTGYAAASWLPIYVATEYVNFYLNPADPPLNIFHALPHLVLVVVVAFAGVNAVLAFSIPFTFKVVIPSTSTVCVTTACRWWRILCFLTLLLTGVTVLMGILLITSVIVRTCMAQLIAAIALGSAIFAFNATCMTIPAILLEDCTILGGIQRSVALTCCSLRSFCLPVLSYIVLNMAWMVPLAVLYWPPPVVLLFLTWIATSWNVILLTVIWKRLIAYNLRIALENKNRHLSTAGTRQIAKSHAILFILLTAFFCLMQEFHSGTRATLAKTNYKMARIDRSGAQALEMLLHHAYAYHIGADFGGACVDGDYNTNQINAKNLFHNLSSLGVDGIFKFGCPHNDLDSNIVWDYLPWFSIKTILTDDWLESIRSQLAYPEKSTNVFKIAVHIRRGDISPCDSEYMHRYLPNSYYLDMIDRYMQLAALPEHSHKTIEVVIHSTDNSFEPLDVFRDRNYTVKLSETPLADVWIELITSDVLIMSKSSFSIVPALLIQDGVVVFSPFIFFQAIPGWEIINMAEMERYKREVLDFIPICEREGLLKRKRFVGKSGVWFLLRNFGLIGLKWFINTVN